MDKLYEIIMLQLETDNESQNQNERERERKGDNIKMEWIKTYILN